jgi:Alkylmercury lyase
LPEPVHTDAFDQAVRLFVYESFLEAGRPPGMQETAGGLDSTVEEVEASFLRLEERHVLVFAPGTRNIWMANPLSAFPTSFWVDTPRGGYWGTCIWDAFGVIAMLGGSGTVSTHCPDCSTSLEFAVDHGVLQDHEGVAHFAVPARRWWDDIGYT